ncbi:MAG: NUDIX hydrolase [Candidatus Eisenbacteria bacterium]
MSRATVRCPSCGIEVDKYRNPFPTVDLILMDQAGSGVYLVERKNPPPGWALPGGFVEWGESLEDAARREGEEETSLVVELSGQFRAYGDPDRDPRFHTITVVFAAHGAGEARGRDDARSARFFRWDELPERMAFDHRRILEEFRRSVLC